MMNYNFGDQNGDQGQGGEDDNDYLQEYVRNRQPPPLSGISNKGTRPVDNWIKAMDIYTVLLKNELIPIVYESLLSIYKDAEELTLLKTPEEIERKFLEHLAEVKVWPINIVKGETQAILERCHWFADLLKGVFVSNVMVLSSAQLNLPNAPAAKLRIQIPQCPEFVQTLYTNVAARFFDRPNVFRSDGLSSDQIFDNIRRAKKEIAAAVDDTVVQLIPIRQIISTSMNFHGNNAIIATKPHPQRNAPPPTNQMQRLEQQNRRSNRAYEPATQTAEPPAPSAPLLHGTNQTKTSIKLEKKERQTPPVPALKRAPSNPEQITQKTSTEEVQKIIEEHRDSSQPKSRISFKQNTSIARNSGPVGSQTAEGKRHGSQVHAINHKDRDNHKDNHKDRDKEKRSSSISFTAPKVSVSSKEREEKRHHHTKDSSDHSRGHTERSDHHKKTASMSQRHGNVHIRPSQFKERTGSNAVKQVLGKLNMQSVESSYSGDSDRSSSGSDESDSRRSSRSDYSDDD